MKLKMFGLLAIAILSTPLPAQETKSADPDASQSQTTTPAQQQYRALMGEYYAADEEFAKAYNQAKTKEEGQRVILEKKPQPTKLAPRLFEIAEAHPDDPYAAAALVWIVKNVKVGKEASKAIKMLERYTDNSHLDPALETLVITCPAEAETLLRAVIEKNPRREIKGLACYALARTLSASANANRAKILSSPSATPADDPPPDELARQSEELFTRVIESYGDIEHRFGGTLAAAATSDLFDLRHLAVGKVAPEIQGEDLEETPFQLSDYRGKVTVLVFSGNWCAPCRAMYPHDRALVARLADKPFALLAINSDRNREAVKQTMAKGEITWRSWWDGGGTKGPIATQYNVRTWPAIFVLDDQGVIRYRDVRAEALDDAVDTLLAELVAKKVGM